jgi:predicted dehydrogenase
MSPPPLRIIMNGVSGRMGYRQHLVRSVLAIRDAGGLLLSDGLTRVQVEPVLVGRSAEKLRPIAERHGVERWTTSLDEALADPAATIYFEAQVTHAHEAAITAALAAGKHVYTEKPLAETSEAARRLERRALEAGVRHGVVQDKLYLPGLRKLRRLIDGGVLGRLLSLRGEFGYWVFEGDWQPAQRPSWNYRAQDGGGMVLDMFAHWNYVLENLVGRVEAVSAKAVTHIPRRWDEQGEPYDATADDAAYGIFELEGGVIAQINCSWSVRVHRDELVEFQVDGTDASAVAGLFGCRVQHRASTPKAVWNPDEPVAHRFRDDWLEVPDNEAFGNGFRAQWEEFLRAVVEDRPHPHDFGSGVRGVALAEAGLRSSAEGRRIEL